MATVKIKFSIQAPSYIAANPTKILENDEPLFFNNGTYVFGDGVTQLQNLTVFGTGFNPSGTNLQYIAGDGSYVTFPTFSNGITSNAGTVKLGGNLTEATFIDDYSIQFGENTPLSRFDINTTDGTTNISDFNNPASLKKQILISDSLNSNDVSFYADRTEFSKEIRPTYTTANTIGIFDASNNLISANTSTYPSLTELSRVKGVTSAIQTQIDSKYALMDENMPLAAMNASTTYYWSNLLNTNASGPRTTAGQSLVSFPYSGTIVGASITCLTFNGGVSTNAMTISVRINGVDYQLSNTAAFSNSASTPVQTNVTGLNIAYTAGQGYEIKCVTPAWSSAPSLAIVRVVLVIKF